MGLVSYLQRKDKAGGGRGIIPNALASLIHRKFFEPGLEDQRGSQQAEVMRQALKRRALVAAVQKKIAPVAAAPAPAPVVTAADPYAEFASLRQFRNKSNQPIDGALMRLVIDLAKRQNVEPRLAGALAIQESDWNPEAVSPDGGYGLYQLTPRVNPNANWDMNRIRDPEYNANIGLARIAEGLKDADKLGFTGPKRTRHALRRYNSGPEYWKNVPGWGGKTRAQNSAAYADSVLGWYNQ